MIEGKKKNYIVICKSCCFESTFHFFFPDQKLSLSILIVDSYLFSISLYSSTKNYKNRITKEKMKYVSDYNFLLLLEVFSLVDEKLFTKRKIILIMLSRIQNKHHVCLTKTFRLYYMCTFMSPLIFPSNKIFKKKTILSHYDCMKFIILF